MRVTVDENLCEANGFCESLAPEVFELGDADVVQIADGPVPPRLEIDVRAAVDQCPKAALRLCDCLIAARLAKAARPLARVFLASQVLPAMHMSAARLRVDAHTNEVDE